MQPLNAIDSIGPAFTRTHETLFAPFRWGRSWKLAAVQYLGFCGAMFVPLPLFLLLVPMTAMPNRNALLWGSMIPTVVGLIALYFCARMELVAFEMIATRAQMVAPMWRRYAGRVWPWLGFKIVVGTLIAGLVAMALATPSRHAVAGLIASFPTGFEREAKPDPVALQAMMQGMMGQMVKLEAILLLALFLLKIPSTLLNDFVLPFFVLEDISLGVALRRGCNVFVADPVQVLLYLILKPILFVIGWMVQSTLLSLVMVPVFLVVFIATIVTGLSSRHAGSGGGIALVVVAISLGAVLFGLMIWATIGVTGYLFGLLEGYGIYFLGGRYPLLGTMLEEGPGAPFTPPPVFPSDEERKNDDGGPPMPMDPAVA